MSNGLRAIGRYRPQRTAGQLLIYLSGCLLFACGGYLFIFSDLGTDPLDVLALGLLRHVPGTVGLAQSAIAVICIGIWSVIYHRRPILSPLFTFFFCGSVIDLLRWTNPAQYLPVPKFSLMLLATLMCAYASALIIMSGIGIRAMDLIAIALVEKRGWPLWRAKMTLEGVLLLTGYLLGGPVGVGTLCFLTFVDTLIQPSMWLNGKVLRMQNTGLPKLNLVPLIAEDEAA